MSIQSPSPTALISSVVDLLVAIESTDAPAPAVLRALEKARQALRDSAASSPAAETWSALISTRRADVVLDFYQAENLEDLADTVATSSLEAGAAYHYGAVCFVSLTDSPAKLLGELNEEWAIIAYGLWLGIHSPRIYEEDEIDIDATREHVRDLATRLHEIDTATIAELRRHFYVG